MRELGIFITLKRHSKFMFLCGPMQNNITNVLQLSYFLGADSLDIIYYILFMNFLLTSKMRKRENVTTYNVKSVAYNSLHSKDWDVSILQLLFGIRHTPLH